MKDIELIDPSDSRGFARADVSQLLTLASDRCAKLGIDQRRNRELYRNAVLQLEIIGHGSDLLEDKYKEAKEKLITKLNERLKVVNKNFNSGIKSSINDKIKNEIAESNLLFDRELHKLIMLHLSPLFYEKHITSTE